MGSSAARSSSRGQQRLRPQSTVRPAVIVGLAVMALGAGLFGFALFHAFAHGSCSSTGYSAHYGPVARCAGGTGWWMLLLLGGIFTALGGAALSGIAGTMLAPVMFIAIGAPFLALGLGAGHGQLAYNTSPSTGRLEVGIFGACFLIAGLGWAVFAGRSVVSGLRGSQFTGLLAAVAGVGAAFAISAGVASAIGTPAPSSLRQAPVSAASAAASAASTRQLNAAAKRTSAAIAKATAQARTATRLAACVTAARTNNARIQACEAKYMP
jgi:hypothetical protein